MSFIMFIFVYKQIGMNNIERRKAIKMLHMKLDSLDQEIDEHGKVHSYHALKEYKRILNEIDKLEQVT